MGRPGRPSIYTEELADEICRRVALGRGLQSVCDDDDMPSHTTVWRWLAEPEKAAFREKLALARAERTEVLAARLARLGDDVLRATGPDVDRANAAANAWAKSAALMQPRDRSGSSSSSTTVNIQLGGAGRDLAKAMLGMLGADPEPAMIDVTPERK